MKQSFGFYVVFTLFEYQVLLRLRESIGFYVVFTTLFEYEKRYFGDQVLSTLASGGNVRDKFVHLES